jgi:hypothetical protein
VIYRDYTAEGNTSSINAPVPMFNVGETNNAMYFGTLTQLDAVYINLQTAGANMVLIAEYWNGTSWINITTAGAEFKDGTNNLTRSGSLSWELTQMIGWDKYYLPDLIEDGYELFLDKIKNIN